MSESHEIDGWDKSAMFITNAVKEQRQDITQLRTSIEKQGRELDAQLGHLAETVQVGLFKHQQEITKLFHSCQERLVIVEAAAKTNTDSICVLFNKRSGADSRLWMLARDLIVLILVVSSWLYSNWAYAAAKVSCKLVDVEVSNAYNKP